MSQEQPHSNVKDISLALLLAGAGLLITASRTRLLFGTPLWIAGIVATAAGAAMRPTATRMVGSIAGEESLWVRLKSSVSVMEDSRKIYDYLKNPLNWPAFMPDIDVVQLTSDRYEITKRAAPGVDIRQQIMIIEDIPYHRIGWVSLGEELPHRGSVELTTNGGTYVTLNWEYKVAVGPAFNAVSKQLLRRFNEVLLVKLQRFKQIMESGGATVMGPTGYKTTSSQMLLHVLKSDADRAFADFSAAAS